MVVFCNNNIERKKLHGYLYAYESILRTSLPPSAKVLAQILIYQGALEESGCCLSNETLSEFMFTEKSTIQRQSALLVELNLFFRNRHGASKPYTYYFNRNTEEWRLKTDV